MSENAKTYYVTTASNHPRGSGYWEVVAPDRETAKERTWEALDAQWSFIYDSLDKVHPLDRKKHGRIG